MRSASKPPPQSAEADFVFFEARFQPPGQRRGRRLIAITANVAGAHRIAITPKHAPNPPRASGRRTTSFPATLHPPERPVTQRCIRESAPFALAEPSD
jgi:hypothetical protein